MIAMLYPKVQNPIKKKNLLTLAWNGKCHRLFIPIVTYGFSNEKKIRTRLDFIHRELIGSLDFCNLFIMRDKLLDGRDYCVSFKRTRPQRRKGREGNVFDERLWGLMNLKRIIMCVNNHLCSIKKKKNPFGVMVM